jgi:hypothetical protein
MGKYFICDWEMAMAGPIGIDVLQHPN